MLPDNSCFLLHIQLSSCPYLTQYWRNHIALLTHEVHFDTFQCVVLYLVDVAEVVTMEVVEMKLVEGWVDWVDWVDWAAETVETVETDMEKEEVLVENSSVVAQRVRS